MKNKEFVCVIFIACLVIGFCSCAVLPKSAANRWLEYELPPSKIVYNGEEFFGGKLSGKSRFSVFYDKVIADDADFYYVVLQQDFGWRKKDADTWVPQTSNFRREKIGYIYVNPDKRVAVYFSPPKGNYSAFKVSIK